MSSKDEVPQACGLFLIPLDDMSFTIRPFNNLHQTMPQEDADQVRRNDLRPDAYRFRGLRISYFGRQDNLRKRAQQQRPVRCR